MEQNGPSFWADIKKYEDTLDKDPNSYCFAPLSELYRKMGMVDDAILVAKRGCELHPEYVGGYMALGRAYYEKGMHAECRSALEKVVRITPDNLLAQRMLSQIYIDAVEIAAAEKTLKSILAQNPEDVESQILLNSLARIAKVDKQSAEAAKEHLGVIGGSGIEEKAKDTLSGIEKDELSQAGSLENWDQEYEFILENEGEEILDLLESEIVEEPAFEAGETDETDETDAEDGISYVTEPDESAPGLLEDEETERKDPLTTVTLAELYVAQGFPERAAAIYRELLVTAPDDEELKSRLIAVEKEISSDVAGVREDLLKTEYPDPGTEAPAEVPVTIGSRPIESAGCAPVSEQMASVDDHPAGSEEHVIHTLEMWLENIRRRR